MTSRDVNPAADSYGEQWADVYDDEHSFMVPSEDQLARLVALAGNGRALELGIGTGRVALPLAARGVDVGGLDASPSMVARLRAKPGGHQLTVTIGDMADPPVTGPFRLVYVVFNTFFNLLTQQQQVACFRNVADLLEPDGVFLLECFVPDLGRFDQGQSLRTARLSDHDVRLDASRHDPVSQNDRLQRGAPGEQRCLGTPHPAALRLARRDRSHGRGRGTAARRTDGWLG